MTSPSTSSAAVGDDPLPHDRAERLIRLLQRTTALANESVDADDALRRVVRDVCDTMGWPAGQTVTVDEDREPTPAGPVHRSEAGHAQDADRLTEILHWDDSPVFTVLTRGEPHWIGGVELDGPDGAAFGGNLTRMWLGFPVTVDDETVAVLHFITVDEAPPADDFLETMAAVGRQLGVLIERNRALDWLEAVNDELERSNRELEQFAYVASHDLQEPLRKIIGFAELLEQRYADRLSGEAEEFLGFVTDAAFRMRQLIEDLLAYSRAGRRRPEMSDVDMDAVVDAALDDLQAAIDESGAQITVRDHLPVVRGNASELRELLVNVIGNALKYRSEADPEVTVEARRNPDGGWRLSVADNGIGIAPQHQERIFEVFRRLHGRGQYSGTGIGLAVCRQIVDHHGGEIRLDSTPGEGSTFHITLPPAADDSEDTDG